jgi:hypothetical protein
MYWLESNENGFLFSIHIKRLDNLGPILINLINNSKPEKKLM